MSGELFINQLTILASGFFARIARDALFGWLVGIS